MTGASSVSVIVVNYKSYAELDACLASLRPRGDEVLQEILVVDNASTASLLRSLAGSHPGVRFLPQSENLGFAAGTNEGVRHAGGAFFLLVNPDSVVVGEAVATLANYLNSHPDVAIVGPRVYDSDGTVQRSARSFPSPLTALFGRTSLMTRVWPGNPISRRNLPADDRTTEPLEVDWVAGSCLMVRADAFRSVGGFDERFFLYWEDADLCLRLRSVGWRIVHLPSAAVVHQAGRSSRHAAARSIIAFHRSALRYCVKHARGPGRYPLLAVAAVGLGARMVVKLLLASVRARAGTEATGASRSAPAGR
jgi:hypothetical protein